MYYRSFSIETGLHFSHEHYLSEYLDIFPLGRVGDWFIKTRNSYINNYIKNNYSNVKLVGAYHSTDRYLYENITYDTLDDMPTDMFWGEMFKSLGNIFSDNICFDNKTFRWNNTENAICVLSFDVSESEFAKIVMMS